MSPKVAVVIPFFQREKGLLRRAVRSVLGQARFSDYCIIIIDDGSPVRARDDVADLLMDHSDVIRIIEQENAGSGSARNKGLDSVGKETEYVAFLDSDDEWKESHLETAFFALEMGYDFYFSDFIGCVGQKGIRGLVISSDHAMLDDERQVYEYTANAFDDLLRGKGAMVITSAVVYRYNVFSRVRFLSDLFGIEDTIFWLDLSALTKRVVFSSQIDVQCNRGVNVWANSVQWDSEGRLGFISNAIKVNQYILRRYCLNTEQVRYVKNRLASLRHAFIEMLLHDIRKTAQIDTKTMLRHFRTDYITYLCFLPSLVRIVYAKFKGLKSDGR